MPSGLRSSPGTVYRPDIDGLRAIAVIAVVLFHFGVWPVSGGFVGVDVFFVISGYLITGIVAADLDGDRFSLAAFYERRLRRIAPALAVVLVTCALTTLFVFLPNDMRPVGAGLINAASFTSNMLFAFVANDYFAADNLSLQPVLHTWSLSVEAQFYLLYPALLLGARRWAVPRLLLVLALLALSFATSLWGVSHRPAASFYLLPTRAWELLVGAALAMSFPKPPQGRQVARALGWAGLGLIVVGVLSFGPATPFPGAAALLPCAGAAAVILAGSSPAGQETGLARLLSSGPALAVGRASYSVYLWHWPILVFGTYGGSGPPSIVSRLVMLGLTVVLGFGCWRFIERPFITRRWLRRKPAFVGTVMASLGVAVCAGILVNLSGRGVVRIARMPETVLALADGQFDRIEGECRPADAERATSLPCRFGDPGATPSVVVWGNSYARMWAPGLDRAAARVGAAGLMLVRSKCPPLWQVDFPALPDCAGFNAAALDFVRSHPSVKTVVLGADWFAWDRELPALEATLGRLREAGVRIFVLLAPPQADYPVPRTLALAALRGQPPPPPLLEAETRKAQQASVDVIEGMKARDGYTTIDPTPAFCDGVHCLVERAGRPLYYDAGHVTVWGALSSDTLFDPVFRP